MDRVAVDIETNWKGGTDRGSPYCDDIVLIQLNDGKKIWITDEVSEVENILADPSVLKIFHNGAFDIQYLQCNSFDLRIENVWDTMLAERLIYLGYPIPQFPADLASVVQRRCGVVIDKAVRETFKSSSRGHLSKRQIEYGKEDVRYLLEVQEQQQKDISSRELDHIMWIENTLVPIVAQMELLGIGFDVSVWDEMLEEEENQIPLLQREIWDLLGSSYYLDIISGQYVGTLNIGSTNQLQRAFQLKGVDLESTNEETLLKCGHPAAKKVLEWREHTKRITWDYPKFVNEFTGRIHADVHQMGARSGRFSYSDPNLQQVPKDNRFRRMFVPADGNVFVAADYGQQEMRILAELTQCENLIKVCRSADPHLENAKLVYEDDTIEKSDPRRNSAKNTGFALTYGASLSTFAITAGITEKEAKGPYGIIKREYAQVDDWGKAQLQFVMEYGYSKTAGGRRRHLPGVRENPGKYATIARNTPIQGTAADMLKLAMIYIDQELRGQGIPADIVLCVHDEIVVETLKKYGGVVKEIVEEQMVLAGDHYVKCVPNIAEAKISDHWEK